MDLRRILAELYSERDTLDEAIAALEKIAGAKAETRRRRTPAGFAAVAQVIPASGEPVKKRSLSAEVRKRMAEAQKRRWQSYRMSAAK